MNIHWRFPKNWHLDLSLHRRQPVLGVNSKLVDGNHFLMWDFDNGNIGEISLELKRLQLLYHLPEIIIMQSSRPGNYHAYCQWRMEWAWVVSILAQTKYLDQQYFKLGIMRGYFTLRFTDKVDSQIHFHSVLPAYKDVNVWWHQMQNFERYWARRSDHAR